MSLPYVRPNAPTFLVTFINHIYLLRNSVSIHVEYDSDWLLVGFTFYLILVFYLRLACLANLFNEFLIKIRFVTDAVPFDELIGVDDGMDCILLVRTLTPTE